MPNIDLSILNQRQTPAFYADTLANRPAAGFVGRIFVSTNTLDLYRDNGTTWDLLSPANAGTVTGGGSLYRVGIWTSTSNLGESNNLVFDYSTNRLGINTNTPGASLDVHSAASSIAQFNQTTATNNSLLVLQNSGSALWRIGNFYNLGENDFGIYDAIGAVQPFTIKKNTQQVLIGGGSGGSGKLVVTSGASDNGVQIVGANAPSLRIDNLSIGATKRVGLGISTALNNFIQGAVDGNFCIFNGTTSTPASMLFGIYDSGLTNVQEAARINFTRNFLINTTTDAGQKLQVNGTALIQNELTVNGTGTTTIDRISINRIGSDARINALGGGYLVLNAPRVGCAQNVFTSNTIGSSSSGLILHSGLDNTGITEMQFRSSTSNTIMARFMPTTGNFGINTTTDAGYRLDVNGTTRFGGTTFYNASAGSIAAIVGGTNIFSISSNDTLTINPTLIQLSSITLAINSSTIRGASTLNGNNFNFTPNLPGAATGLVKLFNLAGNMSTQAGGNIRTINIETTLSNDNISQTFTGIYYNPTVTGLLANTNHKAFENTTGNVCVGTTSGNLLIGTATSGASKLRIVGLPTSAAGLSSGDVYSNAGILTIVP